MASVHKQLQDTLIQLNLIYHFYMNGTSDLDLTATYGSLE